MIESIPCLCPLGDSGIHVLECKSAATDSITIGNTFQRAETKTRLYICPRCQAQMTETVCEHFIIRSCVSGHYSCKDIDGITKLTYAAAIGGFGVLRNRR